MNVKEWLWFCVGMVFAGQMIRFDLGVLEACFCYFLLSMSVRFVKMLLRKEK